MKNVLVVLNYNAGRKKAVLIKKSLHKFFRKKAIKHQFISIADFSDFGISEFDVIFAVGGDGTVNHISQKIIKEKYEDKILAVIPSGSANLLMFKLGLSLNLNKTLDIIQKNKVKEIDVIEVNGKYCILRLGFGFDSDIICKTPQSIKNKFGYFAYFVAGIIFSLRLKQKKYVINADSEIKEVNASCIIIANSANMFRNLISLSGKSELDDGMIDLFILKTDNPVIFFIELIRIIFGIRKTTNRAEYLQARDIKIKNAWSACHIDGEKQNLKGDINIKISDKKIKVYSKTA